MGTYIYERPKRYERSSSFLWHTFTILSQLVKTRASRNKIAPDDWHQLVSAVLEHGPQLKWKRFLESGVKSP